MLGVISFFVNENIIFLGADFDEIKVIHLSCQVNTETAICVARSNKCRNSRVSEFLIAIAFNIVFSDIVLS